jgi:hypothetical protein
MEDIKTQIKEMEDQKRQTTQKTDKVVTFDQWYHLRKESIPACHLKEILLVDFASRGLKTSATVAEFDKALKLYGVEL